MITDTASLHASAWKAVFDEALSQLGHAELQPFDRDADYRRYVDGRAREDGVRSFLASRGIVLEEDAEAPAAPSSEPQPLTVRELAERKQQHFAELLTTEGVTRFPDAVELLDRLRSDGIPMALVTSSRNCARVLEATGLAGYFAVTVDGNSAIELGLPGKPDPAMFLEAARRLEVAPRRVVLFEDAEAGVKAGMRGGFGLVVGVARNGQGEQLLAAGADIAVADLVDFDLVASARLRPVRPHPEGLVEDPWVLRYDGFDAASEGQREVLCTVGNGYWATRGAAPEARAGRGHYPGTYLAGVYNRLRTPLIDRTVEDEHLVNAPNWLPLEFRIGDGDWFQPSSADVIDYRQELQLRDGVLIRTIRIRDAAGRVTRVVSRRFVSQHEHHLACLETTFAAENWSGTITVRSGLDAGVANRNVDEYTLLADTHLLPVSALQLDEETITLEAMTSQSQVFIALAARTRVFDGRVLVPVTRRLIREVDRVGQEFRLDVEQGRPLTVEKVVLVCTSRDRAIASAAFAVATWIERVDDVPTLLADHGDVWKKLWDDFSVTIDGRSRQALALNLNTFHVLQTVAAADPDLDAGVPARGLHGEGYRGHVFWDEVFVYPMLTMRRPDLSRALLGYRRRRLSEARAAARAAGHAGAMYPWQSGIDGREETPTQLYNLRDERWIPDNSHLQRHVGLAVAYGVWEYFETTADTEFLLNQGLDMLVEITRFFASLTEYDSESDRYDITGIMGPDEFHDAYPGATQPGLRNNAYTNVMTAWVMKRAIHAVELLRRRTYHPVWNRLRLDPAELELWAHISRRLRVPFHADGVISQFEGYELLPEFDWDSYKSRYGQIGRLDLILHAEGDSTNNYRLAKQPDVLVLLYLFSAEELRELLAEMGYSMTPETVERTVEFYSTRSSHGSTLSNVVHSWVETRRNRTQSWEFFVKALDSDLADIQGGTTREGIHLGAIAGSIDMVIRCYTGLEFRRDALWFNPMLPPEIPRVHFTMKYREQPITVKVTATTLRLTLDDCDAEPITVHTPLGSVVLSPGDDHEFDLGDEATSADAAPRS